MGSLRSNFHLQKGMMSLTFLVLGLLVSTNICQASFAASDASKTADQKISLKRQILEEILAEIEQQELALQRQLEQQQTVHIQQQQFDQQQRQLLLQQQQHLQEQQILHQHLQQHQQQDQRQAQQRQLRQQIQHLLELELPQNNQLIDSLTEKVYEVALICTNSKCSKDFDFERKKVEITKVIEPFTDLFIARMLSLVAPEFIAVSKNI